MNKSLSTGILLLYLFFGNVISALSSDSIESEEIIVFFEPPLRSKAEDIIEFYPKTKAKLEKIINWEINFKPVVVLFNEREMFLRSTGDDNIVAFARPERNLIVIDYSRMRNRNFIPESLMEHELCHLLIHQHIHEKNLPKWFDEGLAQWVSNGISDMLINDKSLSISSIMLSDRHINIRSLEQSFPRETRLLMFSYEVSKSFVGYIINEYGLKKMQNILERLESGENFETSVLKTLSVSFEELEMDWNASLKNKNAWFRFLIAHLYEILFSLAAILLIVGFIKAVIRKRTYNRYEDEEDSFFGKK